MTDKDPRHHAREVFDTVIVNYAFGNPTPASGRPEVHFCGGPPGSGKSALVRQTRQELYSLYRTDVVEVVGDDLRAYLPEYVRLRDAGDHLAADKTDDTAGYLVEMAVDWTIQRNVHTVIEGTFRSFTTVNDTAKKYREHGYLTIGHVLAMCPYISRYRIFLRYVENHKFTGAARYTVPAAHERSFVAQLDTIEKIIDNGIFDSIHVYDSQRICLLEADINTESWGQVRSVIVEGRQCGRERMQSILDDLDNLEVELHDLGKVSVIADLCALRDDIRSSMRALEP